MMRGRIENQRRKNEQMRHETNFIVVYCVQTTDEIHCRKQKIEEEFCFSRTCISQKNHKRRRREEKKRQA